MTKVTSLTLALLMICSSSLSNAKELEVEDASGPRANLRKGRVNRVEDEPTMYEVENLDDYEYPDEFEDEDLDEDDMDFDYWDGDELDYVENEDYDYYYYPDEYDYPDLYDYLDELEYVDPEEYELDASDFYDDEYEDDEPEDYDYDGGYRE